MITPTTTTKPAYEHESAQAGDEQEDAEEEEKGDLREASFDEADAVNSASSIPEAEV